MIASLSSVKVSKNKRSNVNIHYIREPGNKMTIGCHFQYGKLCVISSTSLSCRNKSSSTNGHYLQVIDLLLRDHYFFLKKRKEKKKSYTKSSFSVIFSIVQICKRKIANMFNIHSKNNLLVSFNYIV